MTTLRTPPKSKLGVDLQALRTSRPDEWWMDDFTREAELMNDQNKALRDALEKIKGIGASGTSPVMEYSIARNIAVKALEQSK